ncbi:5-formyltetrahydrofolate cyclo-ligase [Limnothrix sp. FACHB-708]|uniref:5-formyltetrahydrofolate cyclo-ligase n=1 Tax=unclassified Limnothrix TaxID=2632864 RepID=UPI0016831D70|nr:5-formyltetrahydrofolate cyclo-ligase [Limnothrix sp. FACHB-708]MBD2592211.1 5-formyltetrahydrofolate cyclo-ligase [Limnothrix sp. FACHB-406]
MYRPNPEKKPLRRALLLQRQVMPQNKWHNLSTALRDRIQSLPEWQTAQVIFAYVSHRLEPDILPLAQTELGRNKIWVLPRCQGELLIWHRWQPGEPLEPGAYGVQEPASDAPVVEPTAADLVLAPCVGADRLGYRLGYGGGYYDRLLAEVRSNTHTIGVCFDFALLDALPTDPWDRQFEAFCTESQVIHPQSHGPTQIRITIKLFAVYQETFGKSELIWELPAGITAGEVCDLMIQKHPNLEHWRNMTRFGINFQFVPDSTLLRDGDELVLIPPVSGG